MSLKHTLSKSRTYEIGMANMLYSRRLGAFRQHLLSDYDLTSIEWFILGVVYDARSKGGIRVTELATRFDVKSTYITAMINSLKSKDLVGSVIDSGDGRARLITATEKGARLVPVVDKRIRDQIEHQLAGKVDEKDLAIYLETLKKLATEFDTVDN